VKIEVWSDFVCPYCYIGKRKLEAALAEFPQKNDVEIQFKSYQLDPNSPPYSGQDFYESMSKKFGSAEQAKQMMVNVADQAKMVGLNFHFDTMKPTNTFNAHRLEKFAATHGKGAEVAEKLLYANFTESKDVGNIDILANIAADTGLDKDEALAALQDDNAYADEVRADIDEAKQFGITGVPFFIFNRKYSLSGAQPKETFLQVLEKVSEEEKSIPTLESLAVNTEHDATCGDDGCDIPTQKE